MPESPSNNYKRALLYIMKYLLEETDENHPASTSDIIKHLSLYGLRTDRRTIYTDIAVLEDFGLDIIQAGAGRGSGYYIGSRQFELPELKLLADAVQSARFITERKSAELIDKLASLTSAEHARELHREVFIAGSMKTDNEGIFYNVDAIYEAMHRNLQIAFQYGSIDVKGRLIPRKGGARYEASPWALTWDNENYYLIAYDEAAKGIKHYRVDKMMRIRVTDEPRLGSAMYRDFDLAAYTRKTFGMFGGEDVNVTFRCVNSFAGIIIDRFGSDVTLIPEDEEHFTVTLTISVSMQFYGWLTALGKGIEIAAPYRLRKEYREYLQSLAEIYS